MAADVMGGVGVGLVDHRAAETAFPDSIYLRLLWVLLWVFIFTRLRIAPSFGLLFLFGQKVILFVNVRLVPLFMWQRGWFPPLSVALDTRPAWAKIYLCLAFAIF